MLKRIRDFLAIIFVGMVIIAGFDIALERSWDNYNYISVAKKSAVDHVVKIELKKEGITFSSGTGFHMRYQNRVVLVTNKHVCDPLDKGFTLSTENMESLEVIKRSENHDLCLLKSDRDTGIELAQKPSRVMDEVILVGHPRGLPLVVRHGHVMSNETIDPDWLETGEIRGQIISTTTYGGSSGSPVINRYGKVVGVLFAGSRVHHTEGFMVPWEALQLFLKSTLSE